MNDEKYKGENNLTSQDSSRVSVPALIIGGAIIGNLLIPGMGGALIGGAIGGYLSRLSTESANDSYHIESDESDESDEKGE